RTPGGAPRPRQHPPLPWPVERAEPAFFATPPVGNRAARTGGDCLVLRPGLPYAGRGRGGEAGRAVIVKITREVLEGYLICKYKGHLKLAGQAGTPSDYEAMMPRPRRGRGRPPSPY